MVTGLKVKACDDCFGMVCFDRKQIKIINKVNANMQRCKIYIRRDKTNLEAFCKVFKVL